MAELMQEELKSPLYVGLPSSLPSQKALSPFYFMTRYQMQAKLSSDGGRPVRHSASAAHQSHHCSTWPSNNIPYTHTPPCAHAPATADKLP